MDVITERILMKKIERGEYGYVSALKLKKLIITICLFAISLTLVIIGYFISGKTRESVFTVLGIVSVLPAAKVLVAYIILFPYKTFSMEEYNKIKDFDVNGFALYDFVMSSSEKIMNIYALVPTKDKVFLLLGKENKCPDYTRDYVAKVLKGKLLTKEVVIASSADEIIEKANGPLLETDEEEQRALQEIKYYMVI